MALAACGNAEHTDKPRGDHSGSHAEEQASAHSEHGEKETNHDGEHHDNKTLHLSDPQASLLDLAVNKAPQGRASDVLSLPATVRFDADRTARIGPRLEAKVVEVLVDLGETVRPGQRLAVLDSVALGEAKSELIRARARLAVAEANYQREKTLAQTQASSEERRLNAEMAYRQARAERRTAREALKLYGLSADQIERVGERDEPLSRFALVASLEGVIQQRELSPGQTLTSHETPFHIVDNRRMWLMIDAHEGAMAYLAPGQAVTFSSRALPGASFSGELDWVSRALDKKARTLPARAVMDNPDERLRAGMTGTVQVRTGGEADTALVPVDAVQRLHDQPVVFVPGQQTGAYRAAPVTLGAQARGYVEIQKGLKPGQPLVTQGAFDLMSALTASTRSAAHSH